MAISAIVDQIWERYDDDGSGGLDKEETRAFVKDTFGELCNDEEESEIAFDNLFDEFDADKSGAIEKNEMTDFIKRLLYENNLDQITTR